MDGILPPEDVDYYNEYGILNKKTGTVFSERESKEEIVCSAY
jgi:hypothetical protein